MNLAHPVGLAYRVPDNQWEVAAMTPSEALKHILTLAEASTDLKDDTQRKVLLRGVVVVAQKGLAWHRMGWPNARPMSCRFPRGRRQPGTMFGHQ